MVRAFVSFLVFGLFCACGPKGSVAPSSFSPNSFDSNNEQEMKRYEEAEKPLFMAWGTQDSHVDEFDFDCVDCPPSVGQVVSMTVDDSKAKPSLNSGNCQGGLVTPNLFLMNRHCIPEDIASEGTSCKNRIQFLFPKVNSSTTQRLIDCKTVVSLSPTYANLNVDDSQPDWVLLEIEASLPERNSEWRPTPVPDNTVLSLFVPLQSADKKSFQMRRIRCVSKQKNLAVPQYQHDDSPLLFLNCERDITFGFSGSLLFLEEADTLVPVATLSHLWSDNKGNGEILVSKKIVASSFACIPFQNTPGDNCEFDPSKHNKLKESHIVEALKSKSTETVAAFEAYRADSHPITWEDFNIEIVTNQQAPLGIQSTWKNLQKLKSESFDSPAISQLFETMFPLLPSCIKPNSLPQDESGFPMTIKMPRVSIRVQADANQKIQTLFEHQTIDATVEPDRKVPNHYFVSAPPRKVSETLNSSVLPGAFSNLLPLSLPLCP